MYLILRNVQEDSGHHLIYFWEETPDPPFQTAKNRVIDVAANIQKREERVEKWAKKTNKKYNREELKIGDEVVLKNNVTNKWDISGVIVESRESILTRNGATAPVSSSDVGHAQSGVIREDCTLVINAL